MKNISTSTFQWCALASLPATICLSLISAASNIGTQVFLSIAGGAFALLSIVSIITLYNRSNKKL